MNHCGEHEQLLPRPAVLDAQRVVRLRTTTRYNQAAALSSSVWIRLLNSL